MMISDATEVDCLFGLINCLPKEFLRESSIVRIVPLKLDSKYRFPPFKGYISTKISYWIVLLIICTYTKPLKWSTMTWVAQIIVPAILPQNYGTKPVSAGYSLLAETLEPGSSVGVFMYRSQLLTFCSPCTSACCSEHEGVKQRYTTPHLYKIFWKSSKSCYMRHYLWINLW